MASELFEPGAPDVLFLIDLSGYVFRAYHAVGPLSSPSGEPTHAVVGTVNMLELLFREKKPHLVAVAMDSGRDTFRRDLFPEYKANRPPPPDDLRSQMKRCRQIVEAFAIPVLREKGVEADDLIATAVRKAREMKLRVVIVSADKDLMQLLGDGVRMWDTMRNKVVGPAEAHDRFGVRIDQLRDFFALTGDTSDNIPGVPSVGPKTAKDLLTEFGTLDGIYESLDQIKRKKLKETLQAHRGDAFLSRELVSLKSDCAVDLDIGELTYGGRDVERLREVYGELGFRRHLDALSATEGPGENPRRSPKATATRCETITDANELAAASDAARKSGRLSIAAELSSSSPMSGSVIGISVCAEPGVAHYVPLEHRYVGAPRQLDLDQVTEALGPVLEDESIEKAGHHLVTTLVALSERGVRFAGVKFDSELASYLLDPSSPHGLAQLARGELGLELPTYEEITKKKRGHQLQFDEIEVDEAARYSAASTGAALLLWEALDTKIADHGLAPLLHDVEMPLCAVLAEMERTGVLVDVARLDRIGKRMQSELEELEQKAREAAGKEFNVNSPRQLETILFDELGMKPIKRTKTSRSTDAATLESLAAEHALPAIVLEHRQIAKLKGTYVDALPELVNERTGRIHTRWEQAVAATGRLSSTDPNLQNIPIRSERGREIRDAFVAPPGAVLVSADYSQIELRVLAHLSEDPVLIEAFRSGQDVHQRTAMEIFDLAADAVTREHRTRAKAVNFGVIYGQGDSGLAKSLGIPRAEAARFIAAYFRRYEGVRRFMDATLESARAGDAVQTLLGRRRIVPDIKSANRARRLAAERIAMNTPIQGTAADLLKKAMLALADPVVPDARMILTVHDELVFEVPEKSAKRAAQRIQEAMQSVYELIVPLVVDVGWGKTWNEAH